MSGNSAISPDAENDSDRGKDGSKRKTVKPKRAARSSDANPEKNTDKTDLAAAHTTTDRATPPSPEGEQATPPSPEGADDSANAEDAEDAENAKGPVDASLKTETAQEQEAEPMQAKKLTEGTVPGEASTRKEGFELDDPFKGLEGLGKDLEDTFAELDEQVASRTQGKADAQDADDQDDTDEEPTSGAWDSANPFFGGGGPGAFNVIGIGSFDQLGAFSGFGDFDQLGDMLSQVARMFKDENAWRDGIIQQAHEISGNIARDDSPEPDINPADRVAFEQLVRVAEMRVAAATGLDPAKGRLLQVDVVNRTQWAQRTIDDYKHLFHTLADSIASGKGTAADEAEAADPMAAVLAVFGRIMGPAIAGLTAGTMIGRLARRALAGYLLPVPRPVSTPLTVVISNINGFSEQWSLPQDHLRLQVCLHEVVHHAVFGVEHVRTRIGDLLQRHAAAFNAMPSHVEDMFDHIDLNLGPEKTLAEIQATMSKPDSLLDAVQSSRQAAIQPELAALVAAITGYVDYVTDSIGSTLIGPYERLKEALHRHRSETHAADRLSGRMLGLELNQAQYDRGAAFVKGVLERAGDEGLHRLFKEPAHLPTPAEVDAPGLWLARIDLPR